MDQWSAGELWSSLEFATMEQNGIWDRIWNGETYSYKVEIKG